MFKVLSKRDEPAARNYMQAAAVVAVDDNGLCKVRLTLVGRAVETWAMPALAYTYQPTVGEHVLVAGENTDECYVIGVLPGSKTPGQQSIKTAQGAVARIAEKHGRECVQVEDAQGRLVFEYNPDGGATLTIPEGDLALCAPQGNIHLASGKGVVCSSAGPVVFRSAAGIDMQVTSENTQPSAMQLNQNGVSISGKSLHVQSNVAQAEIDVLDYRGTQFKGTLERAKWVVEKIETVVGRLFERARNVYRHTEELHQTQAGRMRTLVDGDYHVKSGRVDMNAEKDVKIDGERINLG